MSTNLIRSKVVGIILLITFVIPATGWSQVFPVRVSTSIAPPYSPYLSDYVSTGSQKLMINLSLKDLTVPDYQCKLRITIEGVGITIRTKANFSSSQPLTIPGGGVSLTLYGEELAEYFNPANLEFAGITRSDYEKGARLPEGIYKFTIEALDFYRGTLVSNKGTAICWIILNDPPQLNFPKDGIVVQVVNPSTIAFSWTPRNTASPNAAFNVNYVFRLVEIWPLEGNGYQAFLSQTPLYEITTTSTQIQYGVAEPALLAGRRYAWQVQAVDVEGKDLFKNQGKSEVYVFQFGELLGVPFSLEQTAKSIAGFTAAWTAPVTGQIPDQYRVRYALETDTIPTWYEKITKDRWTTIDALMADSSYRVQVRSEYIGQSSEYSEEVIMKTDSAGNASYACGVDTFKKDGKTLPPLKFLFSGDVFSFRNFNVTVTDFKGENGQYQGNGTMQVPFFSNANINVKFSGSINEKRVMESGEVVSTYTKGSAIDKVIEDSKNIGKEKKANKSKTDSTIVETITHVIAGIIDDVYINDEGVIVVRDTEGKEEKFERPLDSLANEHKIVKIIDAEGTTFVVGKDGNITKTVAQVLVFEKGAGVFGFDDHHEYAALKAHYELTEDEQIISWKAVSSSRPDVVNAVLKRSKFDPKNVSFELENDAVTPTSFSDRSYGFSLIGKTEGTKETLTAFYKAEAEEKQVGRLNVVSYDHISKNLVIVPVNAAVLPSNVTQASVTATLSKIYDQAVVNWKVSMATAIQVDLDKIFDDGERGILSNYSADMRKVINAYGTLQDETYYIFLVNDPASGKGTLGFMPRSKRVGFIYTNNHVQNGIDIVHTIAHELGHGAFNLQHTFKEFADLKEGETKNLMDYTQGQGTELYKYQWDHIHSPVTVLSLFEDDADAASMVALGEKELKPYIYINSGSNEIITSNGELDKQNVKRYYNNEVLTLPAFKDWLFGYEKEYVKVFKIEKGKLVGKGDIVRSDMISHTSEGKTKTYPFRKNAYWAVYKVGSSKPIKSSEDKTEFVLSGLAPGNYKLEVAKPYYILKIPAASSALAAVEYQIGEELGPNQTCTITLNLIDPVDAHDVVTFEPDGANTGTYGFDAPNVPQRKSKGFYEKEKLGNVEYEIPWLSAGSDDRVMLVAKYNYTTAQANRAKNKKQTYALEFRGETKDAITINGRQVFTIDDANAFEVGLNTIPLTLAINSQCVTGENEYVKLGVFLRTGNEPAVRVGQLNVVCRPQKVSTCVLVKVNSGTSRAANINIRDIRNELAPVLNERSFNQAFIHWIVNTEEMVLNKNEIKATWFDGFGNIIDQPNFDKVLQEKYKSLHKSMNGHIIFVVDRDLKDFDGIARGWAVKGHSEGVEKNGSFVNISFSSRRNYETYVHELAHNFGLGHLTVDYNIADEIPQTPPNIISTATTTPTDPITTSTYNFMSYAPVRYMFWKDQWDKIYRNANVF